MTPLGSNTLDMLTKEYDQLRLLLIDKASLIGSRMLYNMDKRLREILHMPTIPFGNLDNIFCGDLCQIQHVHDSWIFQQPTFQDDTIPYSFWKDHVKCFELTKITKKDNKDFVSILNRIRTCSHTNNDNDYLNKLYYKPAPRDPMFPYLFFINKDVKKHNEKMLSLVK